MALLAHAHISWDEFLEELKVAPSSAKADKTNHEELINIVTESVEDEIKRRIVDTGGVGGYTEYHTFREPQTMLTTIDRPITSIVSIKESQTRSWASVTALTNDTDFVVSPLRGQIERMRSGMSSELVAGQSGWWPSGYVSPGGNPGWQLGARAVQLVYKAGYSTTANVPRKIKDVARQLAVTKWRVIARQAQGVSGQVDEKGNFQKLVGFVRLTDEMRQELRHEYRRPESGTGQRDV